MPFDSRLDSTVAMVCGVTKQPRASAAADIPGFKDKRSSAAYCGTVRPSGRSTEFFAAINCCSTRFTCIPSRSSIGIVTPLSLLQRDRVGRINRTLSNISTRVTSRTLTREF